MHRTRLISVLVVFIGVALCLIPSAGAAAASDTFDPSSVPVEIADPLVIERTAPAAPDAPAVEGPVATAPVPDGGGNTVRLGSVLLLVGALVVAVAGRRRWA